MFVGMMVGVRLEYKTYRKKDGTEGERLDMTGVYPVDMVREGKVKFNAESSQQDSSTSSNGGSEKPEAEIDADVPF